jgi:hypothetical protein
MGSSGEPSWVTDVRQKLIDIFAEKNAEALVRILFYLGEEEKQYKDDPANAPAWKILKSTLFSAAVFTKYAERLAEDTKTAEKDERFRTTMNQLYTEMMEPSDEPLPEDYAQGFDMVRFVELDVSTKGAFLGLARSWALIPKTSQAQILALVPKIIMNKQMVTAIDELVGLVNKTGGNVVMVALAAIHLGYEAIKNIRRWWNGEITGSRCVKNIMDAGLTITAGVAGGMGGAALGSLAGPIGTVVGGIVGGIVSSSVMNVVSDRMTQWLFGIPKEEALENAYTYLGVKMTASNHEINTAFRQLCLKYHPDKPGGSNEEFHFLQLNMGVIKASRKEL